MGSFLLLLLLYRICSDVGKAASQLFLCGLILPRKLSTVEVARDQGKFVIKCARGLRVFGLEDDNRAWCVPSSLSSLSSFLSLRV